MREIGPKNLHHIMACDVSKLVLDPIFNNPNKISMFPKNRTYHTFTQNGGDVGGAIFHSSSRHPDSVSILSPSFFNNNNNIEYRSCFWLRF
jgi:hypothetical protein